MTSITTTAYPDSPSPLSSPAYSRRLPYENNLPLFLVTFFDPDTKESISACPRGLLTRTADLAREMGGWECMAGCEYEYFQFKETPKSLEEKKWTNLQALTPGSEYETDLGVCRFGRHG